MKPEKCYYPYCEKCVYDDCMLEEVQKDEISRQDRFDKNLIPVEPEVLRRKEYEKSERGKARHKKYMESEKGKANNKRKHQKQIASGKNAEYCKRYYQKKKLEKMLKINS